MIEPYRYYYQESIKKSLINNGNNHLENDAPNSPIQSRKKTQGAEQDDVDAHHDNISVTLKTPPPTPSPPSSLTASQRRNLVKSLNKKPSMTKRLEKTPRIPKAKPVKASLTQHQRQQSSQQLRRHYKDKRPSSYTSATRPRKINTTLRPSHSSTLKYMNRTTSPPFDKDVLDTFCFHWPAMHCYLLVRILPRSIAILPIRTRLAFLYFCHAPRPRQPSLQDLHRQQLHGRRIQSMFKSWKHTLAFNDSSSSSSDDDNDRGHNTNDIPTGLDRSMANEKAHDQQQVTKKDSSTQLNEQHHHHHHQTHHRHHQQRQPHHQHHHHHHHHHSKPVTHRHTASKDRLSKHSRQRSALSTSTEEGDIKEGKAVTLSDVLKDHRTGDVSWIHAPCKLKQSTIDVNTTDNFVTLQSKRTTLELKARCYSEKKMFMNLFKLNRLMYTPPKQARGQPKQQQHITESELIKALETQNDKLQSKVNDLHDQMERWQQDILYYEEQCDLMDEKLDMTMTAVQHHKEQHVDYEELTETMSGTRQELQSHMDEFLKTHQRILHQHAGNTGSFSWVIEKSFQRLHRFQDLHSTQSGPAMLYMVLVTGIIVLLLAVYIGYYHTY